MTQDDPITNFRKNNDMVGEARALLYHPSMQRMLLLVKDASPAIDAPLDAPEVTSARLLSQMVGWQGALVALLSLAEPFSDLPELPPEDWGTIPNQPENP